MRDAFTDVPEQIERELATALAEETSDNDQGLDRLPVVRITSLYLRDLRGLPLLTSHAEIELAKQIEAGRKAQDQMLHITDPIEDNPQQVRGAINRKLDEDAVKLKEEI